MLKDSITPALRKLIEKSGQPRAVLSAMGAELVSITRGNFQNPSYRPSAWAPKKRANGKPLLVGSSLLSRSIRVSESTDRKVVISSDRRYAPYHQFGTRPYVIRPKNRRALAWPGAAHPMKKVNHPGLPPRPFFPFKGDSMTSKAQTRIKALAMAKLRSIAGESGAL